MPIDTKKVKDRRPVRFATIADALADARALAAAEQAGTLTRLGNWTLGQALNHLATWIDYAYDGPPPGAAPLWYLRIGGRFVKPFVLRAGLPAGVRFPRVAAGTFAAENVPASAALAHLARNLERLAADPPTRPNLLFGPLSPEQWLALQLRHAELHLSFFKA